MTLALYKRMERDESEAKAANLAKTAAIAQEKAAEGGEEPAEPTTKLLEDQTGQDKPQLTEEELLERNQALFMKIMQTKNSENSTIVSTETQ